MVRSWRAAGILPVFAAGTTAAGAAEGSIIVPANYPESLAVGATDEDNKLAAFSNRGPGPYPAPDDLKPELSAPGVNIRSVQAWNPDRNRGYAFGIGTSASAPHVAGVAALLLSDNPSLSVSQLEQLMLDSALPLTDADYLVSPNFGYGYGLVDALAAIDAMPEPLPSAEGFAWNIFDLAGNMPEGPVSVTIPRGTLVSLNDLFIPWMTGADFVNNTWYAVSAGETPSRLYTINTATGLHSPVGSTGIAEMTGLAFDPMRQTLYGSGIIGGNSNLYTINRSTGTATLVGPIASNKTVAGLAADAGGNLYGLVLDDNSLYSIDKDSGAATLIGPVGFNVNFDQDIAFDRDNGVLYGTLYDGASFEGGLFQINPATGAATSLHTFIDQVGAFAIKDTPVNTYTLTANKTGQGTIEVFGAEVGLPYEKIYGEGALVELKAIPAAGWEFAKWVIDGGDVLDSSTTVTLNDDVTAVAHFTELPSEGEINAVVFEVEEGEVSYIEADLSRWALAFFNKTGDHLYDLVEGGSIIGIRSGTKYPELISYAVEYYNYDGDVAKAIAAAEELDQTIIDMIELYQDL